MRSMSDWQELSWDSTYILSGLSAVSFFPVNVLDTKIELY